MIHISCVRCYRRMPLRIYPTTHQPGALLLITQSVIPAVRPGVERLEVRELGNNKPRYPRCARAEYEYNNRNAAESGGGEVSLRSPTLFHPFYLSVLLLLFEGVTPCKVQSYELSAQLYS